MMSQTTRSVYCTIFDINHLLRALTLYRSLVKYNSSALFAFVCVDDRSALLLRKLALERALVIVDTDFLTPELSAARESRTRGEYCWTCKPIALQFLADNISNIDWVVYLDADMMFYADPDSVLPTGDLHYVITPHRFNKDFKSFEPQVGCFNAGYFAARSTNEGRAVIDWWAKKCVESCSVIPEGDCFADQKYLNKIPSNFPYGLIAPTIGLNLGPWNVDNYVIKSNGGRIFVDDVPLVLYHFQGLRLFSQRIADLYGASRKLNGDVKKIIYSPYLIQLRLAIESIKNQMPYSHEIGVSSWPKQWGVKVRLLVQFMLGRRNFVWRPRA